MPLVANRGKTDMNTDGSNCTDPYADWSGALAAVRIRAQALIASLDAAQRGRAPRRDAWSVDQVLEHLVISNSVYATSMARAIDGSASAGVPSRNGTRWKPTLIGRLLRKAVDPSSTRRLRSPRRARPGPTVAPGALERFIGSIERLEQLIDRARDARAANARYPSPLAALIRLNVGDGFAVCVAHSRRHLLQVERTISAVRGAAKTT